MGKKQLPEVPDLEQLKAELKRERYKYRYANVMRSTIFTLIVIAALAVLAATLWLPVLKTYGNSMSPTLVDGSIVLSVKDSKRQTGDIVAFYYNNNILVKRVIAQSGDWVDIDKDGTVFVNNKELLEPYVDKKAFGDCNIELPYQVPESKVFVMGDHRESSVDSRNAQIGCVSEEQIVGKLIFCVWPLDYFGAIH